jgi:hypothetical protein
VFGCSFQHESIEFGHQSAYCGEEDADDHMDYTGDDHEFHATKLDAVGRDGGRSRRICLYALRWYCPQRRNTNALGNVHSDEYGELQHRHSLSHHYGGRSFPHLLADDYMGNACANQFHHTS